MTGCGLPASLFRLHPYFRDRAGRHADPQRAAVDRKPGEFPDLQRRVAEIVEFIHFPMENPAPGRFDRPVRGHNAFLFLLRVQSAERQRDGGMIYEFHRYTTGNKNDKQCSENGQDIGSPVPEKEE